MLQATSPLSKASKALLGAGLALLTWGGQALASTMRNPAPDTVAEQHVQGFVAGEAACNADRVKEAIALIYEQDDTPSAARIALRCELRANAQGRPFDKAISSRIKALIAMRTHDMAALKMAGESLVKESPVPEYTADGHMFIAFACLFGGNAKCAREHVDQARTMFTKLKVTQALEQLQPLEQTLSRLEAQSGEH